MQARSVFKKLLGWKDVAVKAVVIIAGSLVVDVRIASPHAHCSRCHRARRVYDRREARTWRHLDAGGVQWLIRYILRRVNCPTCGVVVEEVPWAEVGAWHTKDFEDEVAYRAQRTTKSDVVEQMQVGWDTVGNIVKRVMERLGPKDRLNGLTHLGVDELSYSGQQYITLVYDHGGRGVVWSAIGKSKETLAQFFAELGPERCAAIQAVSMDMSRAYIEAVSAAVPHAVIVFDRFHLQKLCNEALDELRRQEVRAAGGPREAPWLKGLRWPLLKNSWNLDQDEKESLAQLQKVNHRLYRGHLLKDSLAHILSGRQWRVAEKRLKEWVTWAKRSRLAPFQRLARTVQKHSVGILAYVRTGLNNGLAEGINGKIRVVTKRSYGFRSVTNLIAMIFLCCSGLTLFPVQKTPDDSPTS